MEISGIQEIEIFHILEKSKDIQCHLLLFNAGLHSADFSR